MRTAFYQAVQNLSIEDILINSYGLYSNENHEWCALTQHPSTQEAQEFLFQLSSYIAEQIGQTLSIVQPSIDSFVEIEGQNFRAHIIGPPLSASGLQITLRRVPKTLPKLEILFPNCGEKIAHIRKSFSEKANILICGPTGVGKTSLLRALLNEISPKERLLLLEDSPEIPISNPLHSRLLSRDDRFGFQEGAQWSLSRLVYEALRMRPDRIWIGECRGPEALAIAQAISTGHKGVLSTIHAEHAAAAIERFQFLAQNQVLKSQIPWDLVVSLRVHQKRREIFEFYATHS